MKICSVANHVRVNSSKWQTPPLSYYKINVDVSWGAQPCIFGLGAVDKEFLDAKTMKLENVLSVIVSLKGRCKISC